MSNTREIKIIPIDRQNDIHLNKILSMSNKYDFHKLNMPIFLKRKVDDKYKLFESLIIKSICGSFNTWNRWRGYFITVNNLVRGFMILMDYNDIDYIEFLFIEPQFRKYGLGKLLVKHLKDNTKCCKIIVEVPELESIEFYSKMGFEMISPSTNVSSYANVSMLLEI